MHPKNISNYSEHLSAARRGLVLYLVLRTARRPRLCFARERAAVRAAQRVGQISQILGAHCVHGAATEADAILRQLLEPVVPQELPRLRYRIDDLVPALLDAGIEMMSIGTN